MTATTTYSLICTGPGGSGGLATASVTISSGTLTVSPAIAGLTVSQTQQFTATVPGGGGATWAVDGVAGGNATVGHISGAGLYTAGSAAGTHTILATAQADSTQSGAALAAVTDLAGVYTYHNDPGRSGANMQEYALTPVTVTGGKFGKLASCTVDGAIYAQPLWVANLSVGGVKHNAVFVATQHDSLYAFDADSLSCSPLWPSVSLVDTAHGGNPGETSVRTDGSVNPPLVGGGNGDIQPEIGITSTPVIDPAKGILYVLAKSVITGTRTFYQRLHAIDLATGAEKMGSPILISGPYPGTGDGANTVTFDPQQEGQRPGLALVNGTVYIAWASHGDYMPFYGWMMGYTYNGTAFTRTAIFNTSPNIPPSATGRAGIWMCGAAPAVDSSGNLYVLTGNGPFDANLTTTPHDDFGDSMLKLNGALNVQTYFTPSDQAADYQTDADFGSGGAVVLADLPAGSPFPHLIIGGGKSTHFYVLNRDSLGGYGDSNAVQPPLYAGGAIKGSGALWNGFFYITGETGPLNAFSLSPTAQQPVSTNPLWSSVNHFGEGGGTASISAAGNSNGIAWTLDNANYCTQSSPGCGAAVLYAYDATNVSTLLWNSGSAAGDQAGNAVKFTIPTIANGKVYIGTRGTNSTGSQSSTSIPGELDIYGLKP